jgi:dienelactone hydrolase
MARVLEMEVVQLQPPYHGRRKPRGSRFDGELYWTADLVRSMESVRQTLLDARTLLAWMRSESPVPVGVVGISLGGALAAALTCLEPGFSFSAPFVAHMDLGALLADAPVLGAMRADLASFGWAPRDFAAFMERIGWSGLRPVIPAERIHLFAADDDRFFRPEVVKQMWKRWGEPTIQWYPGSVASFPAARGEPGLVDGLQAARAEAAGRQARIPEPAARSARCACPPRRAGCDGVSTAPMRAPPSHARSGRRTPPSAPSCPARPARRLQAAANRPLVSGQSASPRARR